MSAFSVTPDASARHALRRATRPAHERVDAAFERFDLTRSGGYRQFLSAHARAFLPAEATIDAAGAADLLPDWPERRRATLLRADLADLGLTEPPASLRCNVSASGIWGMMYVLEGSRFGGVMIARALPSTLPVRYIGAANDMSAWRRLIDGLDRALAEPAAREAAIVAATDVFGCFEAAAVMELDPVKT